jgi:hypothetical protein
MLRSNPPPFARQSAPLSSLIGLGFRHHLGAAVTTSITADPTTRGSRSVPPSLQPISMRASFCQVLPLSFGYRSPKTLLVAAAPNTAQNLLTKFTTPAKPTPPLTPAARTATDLQTLDVTELAAIGTGTSTDTLADYSTDYYPLFTPIQLQNLLLRIPATTATAPPTATPLLSPRMTAILASTVASGSSYYGSLDFLISQSVFDSTFPHPVPLRVIPSTTVSRSVDSLSLREATVQALKKILCPTATRPTDTG